jgi:hypothetical protein
MAGAKAEVIATAWTFAARFAALRSRKRSMFVWVRLKACASRTPVISSCKPAVTSPTVSRVVLNALLARRAKKTLVSNMIGMIAKHTSASLQSRTSIAITIPMRLKSDPSSWVRPCERSWFSVSTSFVTRLMRSPTGRRSK